MNQVLNDLAFRVILLSKLIDPGLLSFNLAMIGQNRGTPYYNTITYQIERFEGQRACNTGEAKAQQAEEILTHLKILQL